jgi:hypothetical protein
MSQGWLKDGYDLAPIDEVLICESAAGGQFIDERKAQSKESYADL